MSEPAQRSTASGAPRSRDATVRRTILVLFFLSGACGLIYEVVWMRMLTLVFGATAFATSTILASFFTGLALGSLYFGRLIDKGRHPLAIYAFLEAGIGVFAFLMPPIFAALNALYVGIHRQFSPSFYEISLVRFALSFLALLVPATLMGGTLPVILKFFARDHTTLGWNVGYLYATNTFGAVLGAFSAGFFLILMFGVREAASIAGLVNLLIAGAVLTLKAGFARPWTPHPGISRSDTERREPPERRGEAFPPRAARLALWAIAVSGLCALALEVLWTRALVFFLDNSTHAFTTILVAFLLGISLGSVAIGAVIDRGKPLLAWLGVLEILIGVFALAAIPILNHSTPVIQRLADASRDSLLPWRWAGMRFTTSLSVMLVPTLLMGATFPLVTKIYTPHVNVVGSALGRVYSANTLGGVAGSALAGFVLIPLLGVHHGIILIAAIAALLGGVLVLWDPLLRYRTKIATLIGLGGLFAGPAIVYAAKGSAPLTSHEERMQGQEVLFYKEGIGATVKVFRDRYGDKLLSINGFPVAGTPLGLQDAQKALAHLPLLLSEADSPRVNIIGFGAGGTSWGVMQHDVLRADVVELVPAVIEAARWFPEVNHGVLAQPRLRLMVEDGRNYVLVTENVYDVISIDATSPKMAGNGSLYALDFYELLKRRLSDDGLVAQWLPLHLLSGRELKMAAKGFVTAFPHTTIWFTPLRQHVILVGTRQRLRIDFQALASKLARTGVREELEQLNVTDPIDLLGWFVMGEEAVARYVEGADLNTDNRPYLEFVPAMAYFWASRYQASNLLSLREVRESVWPILTNIAESDAERDTVAERVHRRFEATQYSVRGDALLALGRGDQARVEYNTARRIDPDEKNWMHPVWRSVRARMRRNER